MARGRERERTERERDVARWGVGAIERESRSLFIAYTPKTRDPPPLMCKCSLLWVA